MLSERRTEEVLTTKASSPAGAAAHIPIVIALTEELYGS